MIYLIYYMVIQNLNDNKNLLFHFDFLLLVMILEIKVLLYYVKGVLLNLKKKKKVY